MIHFLLLLWKKIAYVKFLCLHILTLAFIQAYEKYTVQNQAILYSANSNIYVKKTTVITFMRLQSNILIFLSKKEKEI